VFSTKAGGGINKTRSDPDVKFAIVGNRRTGTSHLVSLLDSHPEVACWDGEIFDVGEAFESSLYEDPASFLREIVFRVRAHAVGFKLLAPAMERVVDVWALLKESSIRIVHVRRANLLDVYISYRLASLNQAFTCWYGDYHTAQFKADYEECLTWFEACMSHDRLIKAKAQECNIPRLEIEYSELVACQDRVLDFIGVSRHPLSSRLAKQRESRQSDIILNYQELKDRFAKSEWAWCFDD